MTPALLQTVGFGISVLLGAVVNYAYYVLFAFIIAWVLIGWFPTYPSNGFLQAAYNVVGRVVTPILRPIRSVLPPVNLGGMAAGPLPDSRHLRPLDSPEAAAPDHRRPHRPNSRLKF